jgi:hypothetical protein
MPNKMKTIGEEKATDFVKGLLIVLFAVVLSWSMVYGIFRAGVDIYNGYFKSEQNTPIIVTNGPGKPGRPHVLPTYDFSDTNDVLKGIERELKRMNDIQEHIDNPTRKGGDKLWER